MASWHTTRLRVRFEETDMMGVVYYGKYFAWLEVGRVNLFRDLGITLQELAGEGYHIPVVQAHADYLASARFDDEILVKTRIGRVGNSSLRFENEVYKLPRRQLLCRGHTVHALIDKRGKPAPIPKAMREKLTSP